MGTIDEACHRRDQRLTVTAGGQKSKTQQRDRSCGSSSSTSSSHVITSLLYFLLTCDGGVCRYAAARYSSHSLAGIRPACVRRRTVEGG